MNDLRLIVLLIISSLIGALGGFCIMALPLLLFMFGAGDAGVLDTGFAVTFFFLFVIGFAIAGALTAIMMRIFIGKHIISIKDGATEFAGGSVIGGLVASALLSIPNFTRATALGILLTYAIGGTLCWLKVRANERNVEAETLTTLNLTSGK